MMQPKRHGFGFGQALKQLFGIKEVVIPAPAHRTRVQSAENNLLIAIGSVTPEQQFSTDEPIGRAKIGSLPHSSIYRRSDGSMWSKDDLAGELAAFKNEDGSWSCAGFSYDPDPTEEVDVLRFGCSSAQDKSE